MEKVNFIDILIRRFKVITVFLLHYKRSNLKNKNKIKNDRINQNQQRLNKHLRALFKYLKQNLIQGAVVNNNRI